MTRVELIGVTLQFFVIVIAATGLGFTIVKCLRRFVLRDRLKLPALVILGVSLLIGLGSFGYLWLIAGLLDHFTKSVLLGSVLAVLLISGRSLKQLFDQSIKTVSEATVRSNFVALIAFGIPIVAIAIAIFLSAMQLPYATDELHYHFPEARFIVTTHHVPLPIDSHYFYGNIPKLMEIIFAGGIGLSGFALAHALHVAFLLGFLLLAGGILGRHYRTTTALVVVLLLLFYDDFTWNASTGFVDAATVSLEISTLLLIADWFMTRQKQTLLLAAPLLGLALSIKYSPLPTSLFIAGIITLGILSDKRRSVTKIFKTLGLFAAVAAPFGGFWYLKNAYLFGNPFYPLYFGHKGVSEIQYQGLVNAIQAFGPKTLHAFVRIPLRYLTFNSLAVYFSFYLAPAVLFVKKSFKFHGVLLAYFVLYLPYWFLLATHQHRFLMPAIVVGLVLLGIFLTNLNRQATVIALAAIVFASVFLNQTIRPFYNRNSWQNFFDTKLRTDERKYALGMINESQFLNGHFGCQYAIIETLYLKGWAGNVIDNWSVWHAPSVAFYAKNNRFTSVAFDPTDYSLDLPAYLRSQGIRFIYIDEHVKEDFFADTDPEVVSYRKAREKGEEYLLAHANLVYENGICKLYEIDFLRLTLDRMKRN